MKSIHQQKIEQFMLGGGQIVRNKPEMGTLSERYLRANLIMEEALETINQGLGLYVQHNYSFVDNNNPNLEKLCDGCGDLSVVTIGTLSQFGIPDLPLLDLIDNNNLAKLIGATKRPDGKIIKPANHIAPDFKKFLSEIK